MDKMEKKPKEPPMDECHVVYYDFPSTPPAVRVADGTRVSRRDSVTGPIKPVAMVLTALAEPVVFVERDPPEPLVPLLPWYLRLPRYLLFHALNAALGMAGFYIVLLGAALGIGLLPLCCLGLAILQILALTIDVLARLDVQLANTVPCKQPTMQLHPVIQTGFSLTDRHTLPQLIALALGYFVVVKFLIGLLSLVLLAWLVALPVQAIGGYKVALIGALLSYKSHPTLFVLAVVGCWLLGLLLLPAIARLSWTLTKWFCSDQDEDDQDCQVACLGDASRV